MATVDNTFSSQNVLVGPADIYIGIPAPTSAAPPTQANEVALDTSGQPATVSASISAATNATPIVLTFANFSGYTPKNGDVAVVASVGGNTNANGTWTLTAVTVAVTTTATLVGSQGNSAYTSGGTITIGQHCGLAEGPVEFTITQKTVEIRADQFESPVDAAVETCEAELDITILETDLLTMQRYFMVDYLTNPAYLASSKALQVGGVGTVGDADTLRTMMIISPNRSNVGKWIYVFAFKVYLKSSIQLTFHRTTKNMWKLKFGLIADTSRQTSDSYLQLVKTK